MSITINFGSSPEEIHEIGELGGDIWDIIFTYKEIAEERDRKDHLANYSKVLPEIEGAANKYWLQWNLAIGEKVPDEEDEEVEEWGFDEVYDELERMGFYDWYDYGPQCSNWMYGSKSQEKFDRERRIVWHSKIDIILNRVNKEEEIARSEEHVQLNSFRTTFRPWWDSKPEGGVDYMIRDCDGEGWHLFELNTLGPYDHQYIYLETYEGDEL